MADNSRGGVAPFLAFLGGGLIVAITVLALFALNSVPGNSIQIPTHLALNVKPVTEPTPH